MVDGKDLPWLQDTLEELAWANWDAQVDDVIICDPENRIVRVYNLLTHTLSDPANVDELVGILKGVAGE